MGVEEELLLFGRGDGRPAAVADRVLAARNARENAPGPLLTREMQQEMVEAVSRPHLQLQDLQDEIAEGRLLADAGAREFGATAVALAASPLPAHPHLTDSPRYRSMRARFGATTDRSLNCGFHVHVSIDSPAEGVAVLDRIRLWLPLIIALSSNSAIVDGDDTGYASFRFQTWHHWPVTGPSELFGTVEAYRSFEEELLATGVLLDAGMLYLDARLSRAHPTVEVRVADVCMNPRDAAIVASIVRGLVETAAREWRDGVPPTECSTAVLRLASWKAALCGVSGTLLNPATHRPMPASAAMQQLFRHIAPSLADAGDADVVAAGLGRILVEGSGADRQRDVFARRSRPEDVVADAAAITLGGRTEGGTWSEVGAHATAMA